MICIRSLGGRLPTVLHLLAHSVCFPVHAWITCPRMWPPTLISNQKLPHRLFHSSIWWIQFHWHLFLDGCSFCHVDKMLTSIICEYFLHLYFSGKLASIFLFLFHPYVSLIFSATYPVTVVNTSGCDTVLTKSNCLILGNTTKTEQH